MCKKLHRRTATRPECAKNRLCNLIITNVCLCCKRALKFQHCSQKMSVFLCTNFGRTERKQEKRHTYDERAQYAFSEIRQNVYFFGLESSDELLFSVSDCTISARFPRVAEMFTSSYLPLMLRCTINSMVVP